MNTLLQCFVASAYMSTWTNIIFIWNQWKTKFLLCWCSKKLPEFCVFRKHPWQPCKPWICPSSAADV